MKLEKLKMVLWLLVMDATAASCTEENPLTYRAHLLTGHSWKLISIVVSDPALQGMANPSLGSAMSFKSDGTFEIDKTGYIFDIASPGDWELSLDESTLHLAHAGSTQALNVISVGSTMELHGNCAKRPAYEVSYRFSRQ